jgi:hypothetical protein
MFNSMLNMLDLLLHGIKPFLQTRDNSSPCYCTLNSTKTREIKSQALQTRSRPNM